MKIFLLAFLWGTTVSIINEVLTRRFFMKGTSFIHNNTFMLRMIFDILAMMLAYPLGHAALIGTAAGLLVVYPIVIVRTWRES